MVDASASFEGTLPRASDITAGTGAHSVVSHAVSVTSNRPDSLLAYNKACGGSAFSPSQSPAWIHAWVDHANPDYVVVIVGDPASPDFALTLEIVRKGPFRVARFMGGRHANGNYAPASARFAALADKQAFEAVARAIAKARPDIDLIALERMVASVGQQANPMLIMPKSKSPNVSLAVDLAGGFDALLERASGKRKRKKHRSQTRKFETAGGFRRIEANTPAEIDRLLEAFYIMKEDRFRKMGIANVFADRAVRDFFKALFSNALGTPNKPFVLHALEVDGKLRAVTGSSRCGDRIICEFGAIAEDELAHASPGDFLFFDNIRDACANGLSVYDFSVGDEPYKRLWCDIESVHFDVMLPLTLKGRGLAGAMSIANQLKAAVKNSPIAWKLAKAFRKRRAGAAAGPAETDD